MLRLATSRPRSPKKAGLHLAQVQCLYVTQVEPCRACSASVQPCCFCLCFVERHGCRCTKLTEYPLITAANPSSVGPASLRLQEGPGRAWMSWRGSIINPTLSVSTLSVFQKQHQCCVPGVSIPMRDTTIRRGVGTCQRLGCRVLLLFHAHATVGMRQGCAYLQVNVPHPRSPRASLVQKPTRKHVRAMLRASGAFRAVSVAVGLWRCQSLYSHECARGDVQGP